VYVAGPPEMVQKTVLALDALNVPATRIHHDPLDR
jgi:hypothetical protein